MGSLPRTIRARTIRASVVAVLLGLLAWSGSVARGGFAFDDREVVLENPIVTGALPWSAAFGRDYMHHLGDAGQYRPLATLSFAVDHALWGERARGYHLTNVLLHLAVVGLASWVLGVLGAPWRASGTGTGTETGTGVLLGLSLFALHPALADSVAWIAGRTSMLAALGGLTALGLVAVSERPLGALCGGLALIVGLLAKEDALVFAPAVLVVAASRSRGHALRAAVGLTVAVLLYLGLREHALGAALPRAAQAPLDELALGARLRFGGRGVLEALRILILPWDYPPNYRAAPGFTVAAAPGAWAWGGVVLVLACVLAALPAGSARRRSPARVSVALAALAWLPFLGLVPAGEVFAPRFLYLPLLLAVPCLGAALARLPRTPWIVASFSLLASLAIGLAWQRACAYADRAAYAQAVLARVPGDARSWNDLGVARAEDGDSAGARAAWQRAIAADGTYGRPYSNLAGLALAAGDLDEAERLLRRATELGPANPTARVNLGAVLLRLGRAEDALVPYRRAVELAPGMAPAWRGLGHALARTGRTAEAHAALRRALELDPGDPLARRLLFELDPAPD